MGWISTAVYPLHILRDLWKRAKIADEFILDIGFKVYKGGRSYAALKGFVDAGCNINVDEYLSF